LTILLVLNYKLEVKAYFWKMEIEKRFKKIKITRQTSSGSISELDKVAEEAPLELKLIYNAENSRIEMPLAVTMRTPGDDMNLAMGFLFTEGIIQKAKDIIQMEFQPVNETDETNLTRLAIHIDPSLDIDTGGLQRNFYAASSCGICGKASMDLVCQDFNYLLSPEKPLIRLSALFDLPARIKQEKNLFTDTGGVHTAWLFDANLNLLHFAEDVGRHNAMDKMIGKAMSGMGIPLRENIVLLSGRISFELVQKAMRAGIPVLIAFGAASAGAIRLAEINGMTLAGFLKNDRVNIYTQTQRII